MLTNTLPELWAGIECTINRVSNQFHKQLERNGHLYRSSDIALFAGLGIKKIRYPVLWEQIAPDDSSAADWSWADKQLQLLQEADLSPIIGLVHHGSGPAHTSLVSDDFPDKLAAYAKAFASRFPWVKYYTPVNEPLTTARFSGLYGHWYPHGTDNTTFLKALAIQCKAIILSMQAIRSVNPAAELIQTEDFCKTFSTDLLSYQADFENTRRWLSLDFLTGRVNSGHPLYPWLKKHLSATLLEWFEHNACPPDIIGVNHYITSNRFIDESMNEYPDWSHGGNGIHQYADVEAARAVKAPRYPLYTLIKEIHERYQLPLAITETHLHSSREEMLRWFKEYYDTAVLLRSEGMDIRAVTAWSLLGSFDWNTLVTSCNGFYEPGVFDIRDHMPRPTAIARLLIKINTTGSSDHPLTNIPGAWRRPGFAQWGAGTPAIKPIPFGNVTRETVDILLQHTSPVLVLGAGGAIGQMLCSHMQQREIACVAAGREIVDTGNLDALTALFKKYKPWAVINASGYTDINKAEIFPDACHRVHYTGALQVASLCKEYKIPLLMFSSAHVFDGQLQAKYKESDPTCPVSVYGKAQAAAEKDIIRLFPETLIIRSGIFFGGENNHLLLSNALRAISIGVSYALPDDLPASFSYLPDLAAICLDLLIDQSAGIWNFAHDITMSPAALAKAIATTAGLDSSLIKGVPFRSLMSACKQPAHLQLVSARGQLLGSLQQAIFNYAQMLITHSFNPNRSPCH